MSLPYRYTNFFTRLRRIFPLTRNKTKHVENTRFDLPFLIQRICTEFFEKTETILRQMDERSPGLNRDYLHFTTAYNQLSEEEKKSDNSIVHILRFISQVFNSRFCKYVGLILDVSSTVNRSNPSERTAKLQVGRNSRRLNGFLAEPRSNAAETTKISWWSNIEQVCTLLT